METTNVAKVSNKDENTKKPKAPRKKVQTVRERTQQSSNAKPRRLRRTAGKLTGRFGRVRSMGQKEYHMPLPEGKTGKILGKRVRIVPKFVREAWAEIRLVTWPNRQETLRLTIAVFIFAVVFAVIVGLLDYGLDKLFREVVID